MFQLGIDCWSHNDSLVAVLVSTEHLLLNAYRQLFSGNPIFLAADASCRLTQEGNSVVFPVITTNLAHQTICLAYIVLPTNSKSI